MPSGPRASPRAVRPAQPPPAHSDYSRDMQALLSDGPLKGRVIEVESVEGRPPATIDIPNKDDDGTVRYCLSELSQEGMTAAYSFLYAV